MVMEATAVAATISMSGKCMARPQVTAAATIPLLKLYAMYSTAKLYLTIHAGYWVGL